MAQEQQDVQELLKSAMAAYREGDKERARALFEGVVEADPQNERGWFYLAALVETDEERRVCLGNVVYINPNNERAQQLLRQLESKPELEKAKANEIAPGISRQVVILGAGGIVIVVVLIVGLLLAFFSGRAREQTLAQETLQAFEVTSSALTAIALEQTAAVTATQQAILQLSATPTNTLPPVITDTPTPAPTETPIPVTPAVGSGLFNGTILAGSGRDFSGRGQVPLVRLPLAGGDPVTFYDNFGGAGSAVRSPDGRFYLYTRYSAAGTQDQALELAWVDGSQQPRLLSQMWGGRILTHQDNGTFSADGSRIAFSARIPGETKSEIFVFDLAASGALENTDQPNNLAEALAGQEEAGQFLRQLTSDEADNVHPTWADVENIIYVARVDENNADLQRVHSSGAITPLTNDGGARIEGQPDLGPDGATLVYQAYAPETPDDIDIFTMPVAGGLPETIVDTEASDARPRWSPDGGAVVFSSTRTGDWEIYVIDMTTRITYRATFNEDTFDMAYSWTP